MHVECGTSERWVKDRTSGYKSSTKTKLRSLAVPRANELKQIRVGGHVPFPWGRGVLKKFEKRERFGQFLWHRAKLEMPSIHRMALKFLANRRCFRRNPGYLQWRMHICTHFCIISISTEKLIRNEE